MQKILHPYSMDFNHKYNFTGHLFESRYTACLIEDDRYGNEWKKQGKSSRTDLRMIFR